jgi:hypothetical protein
VQLLQRTDRPPGFKVDSAHAERELSRKIDRLLGRQSVAQLVQNSPQDA